MPQACPIPRSPFASRSLAEHLARGLLAAALIAVAIRFGGASPLLAAGALGGAVLAMRGCPTCWVAGLVGTLADRAARSDAADPISADGAGSAALADGRR